MILDSPNDFSDRFYNYLLKCRSKGVEYNRLLVLAATDVDAVCATKILLYFFRCDNIKYSLIVCSKFQDCIDAVATVGSDMVRTILMINCGAAENVVEAFNVTDSVRFFILDSRMPVHLRNLYSSRQVCVLRKMSSDDINRIPRYEEVFRDDEENGVPDGDEGKYLDDNDDAMSQSSQTSQNSSQDDRHARAKEARAKERETRRWNTLRIGIEERYYKNVYYQDSSAVKMFELARLLTKDDQDLFFCAVIGLCDMFMQRKIGSTEFIEVCWLLLLVLAWLFDWLLFGFSKLYWVIDWLVDWSAKFRLQTVLAFRSDFIVLRFFVSFVFLLTSFFLMFLEKCCSSRARDPL